MIFGIKTKNEKRIEALEAENLKLKHKFAELQSNDILQCDNYRVEKLIGRVYVEKEMPAEWAKKKMASDMAEKLMDYIRFDIDNNEEGMLILTGRIDVVDRR